MAKQYRTKAAESAESLIGLLLRDFKFVKVTGDNILIVDPASRKIVDIITKEEAGQ